MNKFIPVKPNELRIPDLKKLCAILGGEKTLRQILNDLKEKYPHTCPKCEGKGYNTTKINTYPSGLPDSGWVDRMENIDIVCDVCNGNGFTKTQFVAKVVKVEYVEK